MDESALAELAVKAVVGEVAKGGASTLLGWLRGKLTGAAGQEAAVKIAERPEAKHAQLALQAQTLELLEAPGFAAELRARLRQSAPPRSTAIKGRTVTPVRSTRCRAMATSPAIAETGRPRLRSGSDPAGS